LINVWATTCGPCLLELPELVTMNRMYRNGNFELVTISADSPDRQAKALGVLTAMTRTPLPTPWMRIGPEVFLTPFWWRPAAISFNVRWDRSIR
jgi:thiol-disulfide isomerase/thioredoxin